MSKEFKAIDLFCGCGGLSKGFELAGFKILYGIDFNESAIKTYKENFGEDCGFCFDLLELDKEQIVKKFSDLKSIDVIIGGPPCQGFSSANRYKKEGDDPRNKLFFQFLKFVELIKPKAIVIENVSGIITKDNGYAKNRIYSLFENMGYCVSHKILNAVDYGVPQKRKRNFFVITKGTPFDFNSIKPIFHNVTVKEAIGELYNFEKNTDGIIKIKETPSTKYRKYLRSNDSLIFNHTIRYPAEKVQHRISYVPQGGNWQNVPHDLWPTSRTNRHSSAYKRLSENEPSVTIDTGNNHSNYFHPLYNRIPTVREAARLQSFPDDFHFCGNRSEQYRQVGNAVPPILAMALASALLEKLKNEK